MTQPKFAPILEQDEVRDAYQLGVPASWVPHRPGESRPTPQLRDPAGLGFPGPDQGYALELANRFTERLALEQGEHADDVLAGAVAISLRRAAIFGRAPVRDRRRARAPALQVRHRRAGDLAAGGACWPGAVSTSPVRRTTTGAAARWRTACPGTTLRLSPRTVTERLESDPGSWSDLVGA